MRIEDEDAYEAALAEAEALMDARPDTPKGARLDEVVREVELYEARLWPIISNPSANKRSLTS